MNRNDELTQIVKEVQKDIRQFEKLYTQIINKVYFWCYTIAKDEATTKDMTQEAMILIYNKVKTLQHPENFTSWMYRLVRNSCINYLRANKKHTIELPYNEDFDDGFETNIMEERSDNLPEEAYCEKETKELVKSFIDKLPRKQREVITLYYLEELKTTEIADVLDYNVGSVRTRLHAGRKNLELQISDYQKKHNVKLYSSAILPMLGIFIKEYSKELCDKQNLNYDASLMSNPTTGSTSISGVGGMAVATKLIIITIAVICVSVVAIVVANVLNEPSMSMNDKTNENASLMSKLEMFNKLKGHPYIEDIAYLEFPMRLGTDVSIELKKDIPENDINILFDGKEVSFEKNGNNLYIHANENGTYTITTKEHKVSFEIYNIDAYAPELSGFQEFDNYLQLIVNDERFQINYQESFVEYQGEIYKITDDLKVYGKFYGGAKVTLYHQEGYKITYDLNFE